MRAALLSPRTLRTNAAGIEQSVLHVGSFLQKKGVGVEVYCTARDPKGKTTYRGLTLHEFPSFAPGENYFLSTPLFHALKKFDGELIHCNGYNNLVSIAGILAKKKNQKLVITMNSSGSSSLVRKMLHAPLLWVYHLYAQRLDKVICVSQWEYDYFRARLPLPKEKFVMIPNGIDVEEFSHARTQEKKVPHLILSVGRLVRNKGHHRLLAALPLVLQKYPDAALHIVGEGPEEDALKAQAHELGIAAHVTFHGNIPFEEREKLLELFGKAHVFALLTEQESQGIVFGEAAAAGLPMLVVDQGVMHEYVKEGAAMGITQPDDPEKVANALSVLFEKKKEKISTSFLWSWGRVGEAVHRVYLEVLAEK